MKSKEQKRLEAEARQTEYDSLTPAQKRAKAESQMGDSEKVLKKLSK